MKTTGDRSRRTKNGRAAMRIVSPLQLENGGQLLGPDDVEAPFVERSIISLKILSAKGYETAAALEKVLGVLRELMSISIADNRCSRRRICAKAVRMLREAKKTNLDAGKSNVGFALDPALLLLRRALEEVENVALRIFRLDPQSYSERQAVKREVGNLALSILTAERLSGNPT